MATFALSQIDAAIGLFTSLTQHGAGTPRYNRNLRWLLKLRNRASSKIHTMASTRRNSDADASGENGSREDCEDVELLGWRTRLIERSDRERQTIKTIHLPAPLTTPGLTDQLQTQTMAASGAASGLQGNAAVQAQGLGSVPSSSMTHDPTDELVWLHDRKCFHRLED